MYNILYITNIFVHAFYLQYTPSLQSTYQPTILLSTVNGHKIKVPNYVFNLTGSPFHFFFWLGNLADCLFNNPGEKYDILYSKIMSNAGWLNSIKKSWRIQTLKIHGMDKSKIKNLQNTPVAILAFGF
jgi:hypothetical protein